MITYSLVLGILLILLSLAIFRHWRIWVLYFITGGVGTALVSIYLFSNSGIDIVYRSLLTKIIHLAIFQPAWLKAYPASGMFLFQQGVNWVGFEMNIECLGFIEIIVFISLLIFYPPMRWVLKAKHLLLGSMAIFCINILRVILIILLVRYVGLNITYISHTVIARIVFFMLVMGVYWRVFTVETIRQFRELGEWDA